MARVTLTVPVQSVHTVNGKLPLTPKALLFAVKLVAGYIFPPIHVRLIGEGKYTVLNGRNRLSAHRLAGRKDIKVVLGITEDPYPYKKLKTMEKPLKSSTYELDRKPTAYPDL